MNILESNSDLVMSLEATDNKKKFKMPGLYKSETKESFTILAIGMTNNFQCRGFVVSGASTAYPIGDWRDDWNIINFHQVTGKLILDFRE